MAVSCSHGQHLCPHAEQAVLEFRRRWIRPGDQVVHLGDAFDTTCFRTSAANTADQRASAKEDIDAGKRFLAKYRPTIFCRGNHEQRLWDLQEHPDARVAGYAAELAGQIDTFILHMKCKIVPYDYKAYVTLGDFKFFHSWTYGENATRDTAETWGNCCVGHTHRPGMAFGRRGDNPLGVNVGCLVDPANSVYARNRRSTLSWGNSIAWGEYTDARTIIWLHVQPQGLTEWHLPV